MKLRFVFLKEAFSDKSWGEVDKSKLPRACFLVALGDKKEDWHYPYREGAGEIGEDGMYASAGPVNKGALRAIAANLGGARTEKKFSVPSSAMAKFKRLYKAAFGKDYGDA